jgi:hypothetical protein
MANADKTKHPVPSVNVVMWRSKCTEILMEKVRNLAYINMVVHALVLQLMLSISHFICI